MLVAIIYDILLLVPDHAIMIVLNNLLPVPTPSILIDDTPPLPCCCRLCLPTWLFLGKMPHGSKARDFLNEETVNFYKDPSLGSVDTQISEFKPVRGCTFCCQEHAHVPHMTAIVVLCIILGADMTQCAPRCHVISQCFGITNFVMDSEKMVKFFKGESTAAGCKF